MPIWNIWLINFKIHLPKTKIVKKNYSVNKLKAAHLKDQIIKEMDRFYRLLEVIFYLTFQNPHGFDLVSLI